MKVRIPVWKTLLILLLVIVLGAAIIFGFTFYSFLKPVKDWPWSNWAIIGVWGSLSLGLIIAAFLTSYYEVEKKYVVVHKGTKKLIYYYADVVYIDEEQSEKKKVVSFYTNKGHVRYLPFDSKGLLYKAMLAGAKNRLTKEEFESRYPKVKI